VSGKFLSSRLMTTNVTLFYGVTPCYLVDVFGLLEMTCFQLLGRGVGVEGGTSEPGRSALSVCLLRTLSVSSV
jgi:hypothetical protein